MKKMLLLCLSLVASTPLHSNVSEDLQNVVHEKIQNYSIENAFALGFQKIMVTGKMPYLSTVLLSQMQKRVTTSKPAIALLCNDILSRKLTRLYPYVQDNFHTIADYIQLNKGRFKASSWDSIEEILRQKLSEFYNFIPDWARGIQVHAEQDEIRFFQRLFIRRVIEWECEEFYALLLGEFFHLLSPHDKVVLGWGESESD